MSGRGALIALTGPIGSGKSTLARLLEHKGAFFIDGDEIARDVLQPGRPAYGTVVERFGTKVVDPDGKIDRRELAKIVFSDSGCRRDLEAITHPDIFVEIVNRAGPAVQQGKTVLVELPLLYDTPVDLSQIIHFDAVIAVTAPREHRRARLASRGMAQDQADARIAAQTAVEERSRSADYLIENAGTPDELAEQAGRLWLELQGALFPDA